MRVARIVFALLFGLGMAGPEAHACPVHDPTPASESGSSSHHQGAGGHHDTRDAHCTCPQACCLAPTTGVLAQPSPGGSAAPSGILIVDVSSPPALLLPVRKHFLPLALAPPLTLA